MPGRLPSGPGVLTAPFDARHNGPRGTRALGLSYLVDGLPLHKRIARRSPDTARMFAILGCPYAPGASWRHHLAALRELLDGFAALGRPDDVAAGHAYLDLVEQTLD